MEIRDILFILLSSVQAGAVIALASLAWMYRRQVGRMVDAALYQVSASKDHVQATADLMERLDAHTMTSTHMSMMMSKSVNATLELAKANQRLVRTFQGRPEGDIPSIEPRNGSATVSKVVMEHKPIVPQDRKLGNGEIVRVPRRSSAEQVEETQSVAG